ncbi:MAG: hypothetical protein K6C97_10085 [Treponema sp.]|nr:hypothetical protein [Treponema sp.]
MLVVIPHPTEELKLIRFQKELIKEVNQGGCILYAHQPLWIELEDFSAGSKEELKKLSKEISSISFSSLEMDDEDVFLNTEVDFQGKKFLYQLPLLHLYKGKMPSVLSNKKCPVEELKIFRLGIPYQYSETSKSLDDFVWHKEAK